MAIKPDEASAASASRRAMMGIDEAIRVLNERRFNNREYKRDGGTFQREYSNGSTSGPGRWRMITEEYLYIEIATGILAQERVDQLETAIRKVVTQAGDDLCWRDIYVELARLVGIEFNPDLLPKEQMLRNCERFIDSLASGAPYFSVERERAIAKYRGTWSLRSGKLYSEGHFHYLADLLVNWISADEFTLEDVDDVALAVRELVKER